LSTEVKLFVDQDGDGEFETVITPDISTGIASHELQIPKGYRLGQNFPNPFNATTIIPFEVAETVKVRLRIQDILGREVVTLIDQTYAPGEYAAAFDGGDLPSGIYFYEIQMGYFKDKKKMVMLR
jgi:hypothetical protein